MQLLNILSFIILVENLGFIFLPLFVELAKHKRCFLINKLLKRKLRSFAINFQRVKKLKNNFEKTKSYSSAILVIVQNQFKKLEEKKLKIHLKNEDIYFYIRRIIPNSLNLIRI